MFNSAIYGSREQNYAWMAAAINETLNCENDETANLAMAAAFIFYYMDDINWAGFYIMRENCLVIGPFQGKPACMQINPGRGVCGAVAESCKTLVVDDVHVFDGHIACDSETNSEIVLPLFKNGSLYGVLDIDSTAYGRFGLPEEKCLAGIAGDISRFLSEPAG